MTSEERLKYGMVVVLLLSKGGCEEYQGRDCVQSVIVASDGLPFASKEEANSKRPAGPTGAAPIPSPV